MELKDKDGNVVIPDEELKKFNLDIPQEELETLADKLMNDGIDVRESTIFPDYSNFSIQFDRSQQPQFSEVSIDKDGNFEQTVTIPERCRGCPYLPEYFSSTISDYANLMWTITTSEDTSDITINTKGEIV